jgi:hypothetical protein
MDREDIEIFFRCLMQFLRHLAKKYGFKIKQYPENAEVAARRSSIKESDRRDAEDAGSIPAVVSHQ